MAEQADISNTIQLIDTHCHLDIERYFPDCAGTVHRSRMVGVQHLVIAGVDRSGWDRMVRLSCHYPGVHAAPGMHPMYLDYHRPGDLEVLADIAQSGQVVAIGEIGLDYHIENSDRKAQQELFEVQVELASRLHLPLLLHVRKAHDKVLATLRRKRFGYGGIVHAFNGSYQQATHFIRLGFKIGVCGTITYERSRKIRRVAEALPLDSLVLETDAPDIPPSGHFGERNQPEYLPEILTALTDIRNESYRQIAEQTTRNALEVLNLERPADSCRL